MASDLGTGSWLIEPQQSSFTDSFRRWRHQQIWTAKTWWRETTDVVILNSPWLRRGTGRALRSLWVFVHMVWWCFHYRRLNAPELYMLLFIAAGFFILGSFYLLWDRRESLFRTTLLSFALLFSSMLAANLYKDYHTQHAVVHVIVVLCHCNVHPACMLLALAAGAWLNGQSMARHMGLRTWFDVLRFADTFFTQVFELLLMVAFTADFTARVKAVSSGFLFGASGEEVWKSPLAGRAGRAWCWVLSLNNWFLWAAITVFKLMIEQRSSMRGIQRAMQNHLPLCSCLAPCFSMVSLLILLNPRCSVLTADIIFGLFCCLPPALLTIEVMLIGSSLGSELFAIINSLVREMCSASILSSLAAVQIMIQAGCHPYICLFFSILVNSLVVALSMSYDTFWWHTKMSWNYAHPVNPWVSCLLIWILVASHTIDFFARMKAIREGMARSLENAASQSSLLNRSRESGLNLIELPHRPSPDAEELRPRSASSHVAVAVVRHAERADASSTFDTWCTSDDAAAFPWDPPITERGFQQTNFLAQELASKHVDFKVIITSPFLRCLQTAMVLAEYFDADVLVDNELGEVMNTEIFETAPPLPPRPWTKVTAALKTNFCTNRLKAGRFMGKAPEWPESSQRARLRYANRFLEYLRRARHTKKSCLLVTHGHMVQVCATILPATASRRVLSVDYAAAVLAVCHRAGRGDIAEMQGLSATKLGSKEAVNSKSSSFHMPKQSKTELETDQQSQLQEGNELMQQAKLKYWDVWLQGVRTVSTSATRVPQVLQQVHQFQESLGRSYQDMVRLLGVLPPPEEFGDQAMGSESADSIDCQTTSSLAMYQDPSMIPSSPKSAVSGKSGKSVPSTPSVVPRMNVKTFKEVELSLPSSSLAARRARKSTEAGLTGLTGLGLAPLGGGGGLPSASSVPILEVEPMESQAKAVDEKVFLTL